jgi:hypothetical protein
MRPASLRFTDFDDSAYCFPFRLHRIHQTVPRSDTLLCFVPVIYARRFSLPGARFVAQIIGRRTQRV